MGFFSNVLRLVVSPYSWYRILHDIRYNTTLSSNWYLLYHYFPYMHAVHLVIRRKVALTFLFVYYFLCIAAAYKYFGTECIEKVRQKSPLIGYSTKRFGDDIYPCFVWRQYKKRRDFVLRVVYDTARASPPPPSPLRFPSAVPASKRGLFISVSHTSENPLGRNSVRWTRDPRNVYPLFILLLSHVLQEGVSLLYLS